MYVQTSAHLRRPPQAEQLADGRGEAPRVATRWQAEGLGDLGQELCELGWRERGTVAQWPIAAGWRCNHIDTLGITW